MSMRHVTMGLFILLTTLVWWPYHAYRDLYSTARPDAVPADEMKQDFTLQQEVIPPPTPALSGSSDLSQARQPCFGIQFATWARFNAGHINVHWQQSEQHQQWRVDMSTLADNTFRHFCPDRGFDPYKSFSIRISGVNGKPGDSATLWLVGDERLGTADLGNASITGKSIALKVTSRKDIRLPGSLMINHGMFALGWLCTLSVGLIALLIGFQPSRSRTEDSSGH